MVSEKITLTNPQGFHMRPASVFSGAMGKYGCDVFITFGGNQINGKSVMNILAACIKCGADVEIVCTGENENEALKEAIELIKAGLGD